MSALLSPELISIINDPGSFKALATVDDSGIPHVVVDHSIYVGENGNIYYLELLESSRSNHNLVGSIWFDRKVSIGVKGEDDRKFQIQGFPVKVHISGPLFLKHYVELRQKLGDVDLTGVWEFKAIEVTDESLKTLQHDEETNRPIFRHLDRFAKIQSNN
ncbi:MAG TPA: hypothetical protein VN371_02390 [Chlorobaculum sp.]|nr:hypothetical protein [Chlorobaculum sp.]